MGNKTEDALTEISGALQELNGHAAKQGELLSGLQIALTEFRGEYERREDIRGQEIQTLRQRIRVLEGGGGGNGGGAASAEIKRTASGG